eukprot:5965790-Prymnesium_polylepis.1
MPLQGLSKSSLLITTNSYLPFSPSPRAGRPPAGQGRPGCRPGRGLVGACGDERGPRAGKGRARGGIRMGPW